LALLVKLEVTAVQQHGLDERIDRGLEVVTEKGFPVWEAFGNVHRTSMRVKASPSAMHELRESIAAVQQIGVHIHPYFMALLARAYHQTGEINQERQVLYDAQQSIDIRGERWWEAEIRRSRGENMLAASPDELDGAEVCFQQALEISRSQKARSLELRAATSLARLWQQRDRHDHARRLLGDCYASFSEGFDTADLRGATQLLESLSWNCKQP
jgi:adenylate cyclase